MAQITIPSSANTAASARKLDAPSQGQWSLAWRRFKRNKAALAGGMVILGFILVALLAPVLSPQDPTKDNSGKDYIPPIFTSIFPADKSAIFSNRSPAGKSPDPHFLLGTDGQGHDVLSRLIYGTRTSLMVGLLPVLVILVIGTLIGFAAGLAGGNVDNLLMRMTDVFYAFPDVLLLILASIAFGDTLFGKSLNGLLLFMTSLAVVSWSGLARLTRGAALSVKSSDFIAASKSLGMSDWQIMLRHILPNSLSVIVVWAALAIPAFVLTETVLGFLGVGLKPALNLNEIFVASWGRLLLDARTLIESQPWFLILTSLTIATFVIAFTYFGNGLRDALDPRQK